MDSQKKKSMKKGITSWLILIHSSVFLLVPHFAVMIHRLQRGLTHPSHWRFRKKWSSCQSLGRSQRKHRVGHVAHLRAVFDVVAFVEAQVTQVVRRRPLAGFSRLSRQGQVRKVVGQGAQAVHDVGEGVAGRGALVELIGRGLLEGKERKVKRGRINLGGGRKWAEGSRDASADEWFSMI